MKSIQIVDGRPVILCAHARSRLASLRIYESEVSAALRNPCSTYPGSPGHGPNRRVYVGPRVEVVLSLENYAVVTIKLHTSTPYTHGVHDVDNPPSATALAA